MGASDGAKCDPRSAGKMMGAGLAETAAEHRGREGESLDRIDGRTGAMPSAERDGSPLRLPGGGDDTGRPPL